MLVRLFNKSDRFDSDAEKQHEDNQVVLIVVVVPTSRQPKKDRLFPIDILSENVHDVHITVIIIIMMIWFT